jgi:uncharacterized protein (TIGR02646 family)
LYSGYTETSITPENSHIDHVEPRSLFPDRTFDYQNLVAAYPQGNADDDGRNIEYGAHWKGSIPLAVTPLMEGCHDHIRFLPSGKVAGLTSEGISTVQTLHLNHPRLVELRRAAINGVIEAGGEVSLSADSNGRLPEYVSAIACVA